MRQDTHATGKSPAPNQEIMIPTMRAIIPAIGDCVASMIAGKVMAARVTYGT